MIATHVRPLPLGRSTFSTLRLKNEIYVDKTELIFELCREDSKIFLSRPRRFGKSLLVSTFASLFGEGLKDFKGLASEGKWTDKTYCVLHLDFSLVKNFSRMEEFCAQFEHMLQDAALRAGIEVPATTTDPFGRFASLLSRQPASSLVLLIDEYDAPLTAHLDNPVLFEEIQSTLSRFYFAVKAFEGCLRFFFMTGITKISDTGIFSSFNNLTDISMSSRYGTLLGCTEKELSENFSQFLHRAAETLDVPFEDLMAQLKENYNGFCFDGFAETSVYCPWSVLSFLNEPANGFENYWYQTGGQPTVLLKYLRGHDLGNPERFD